MKRKLISMLLAGAMTASVMAGYGMAVSAEESTLDTSEEVNLVMYVVSDRPAGQDLVDENLNNLLKEKMNTTLTINWIPWSDFANKYPLLFSSGEKFDMAYTASWLNFTALAQKGAFQSLDDLWPTYAPKNYAQASDAAKQQAIVDGHTCCVPTLLGTYNAYGPIYRKDVVEGTDWDGVMENFEDIEEYLDIVKETHPELEPLDIYSAGSEMDEVMIYMNGYRGSKGTTNDFLFFDPTEENPQLFTYYECEQVPEFLQMMTRWNEKGFFSKSALSDTDSTKTQNGKSAMRCHNVDTYAGYAVLHPEWDFDYANFTKNLAHLPFTQDAMAIANTSKNPERAMALWDLITSDQEVFDAFFYGILGTSYELNDEGQYTILNPDSYAASAMWAARTPGLNRDQAGTPQRYSELKDEFEEAIAADGAAEAYSGFTIDTSSIETEYAACQSVHQQYWWPLELGYTDAESGLADYQKKMEDAGIEKVREAIQQQLDEYTANISK